MLRGQKLGYGAIKWVLVNPEIVQTKTCSGTKILISKLPPGTQVIHLIRKKGFEF